MTPTPCPPTQILRQKNHPQPSHLTPPNLPIPPPPHQLLEITIQWSWYPCHKWKQCNGCGSTTNDVIIYKHLGSGVGPWLSIPCLLQDTNYVHWLHPPKQSSKKKQKILKKIKLPTNRIILPWPMHTESTTNTGSDKINKLRPSRKNTI